MKLVFANLPDVPIVDATEPIEGVIKRADIKRAISRNPEQCVVAWAMRRTLNGDIVGVKIGATTAYVHFGHLIKRYFVSDETRQMVKAYDKAEFYPTGVRFKLIPPPPARHLGARKANGAPGGHSKGGRPNVASRKTPWLRHVEQAV